MHQPNSGSGKQRGILYGSNDSGGGNRPSQAEEFGHESQIGLPSKELFLVEWKKLLSMVIDNLSKPENKLS